MLGIRVEEIDALFPDQQNQIVMADGSGSYTCGRLCDIVHGEGAEVLATYGSDFYAGTPVITEHRFGQGWAYYIASDPEDRFLDEFFGGLLAAQQIAPLLAAPAGVEVTLRETSQRRLLFVLNHTPEMVHIPLTPGQHYWEHLSGRRAADSLTLPGYDVALLEARA